VCHGRSLDASVVVLVAVASVANQHRHNGPKRPRFGEPHGLASPYLPE
jgi:hypothetical protein